MIVNQEGSGTGQAPNPKLEPALGGILFVIPAFLRELICLCRTLPSSGNERRPQGAQHTSCLVAGAGQALEVACHGLKPSGELVIDRGVDVPQFTTIG
ncbi:MAG TPA: hypothetical protein VF783_00730 [Terriglobales bacterium]